MPELSRFFAYRRAGIASLGVVEIDFGLPLSVIDYAEQRRLGP